MPPLKLLYRNWKKTSDLCTRDGKNIYVTAEQVHEDIEVFLSNWLCSSNHNHVA